MNISKRRLSLYLFAAAVIFIIAAGFIRNLKIVKNNPEKIAEIITNEHKINPEEISVKTIKKSKFKSDDEIKKEYGKLETVTLWNGKNYTGAVVNTNETYRIITVEGIINIPMKDVKMREIIR